jgi:F-type H+-transporting ATPase subunit delta
MSSETIARRYATALADVVLASGKAPAAKTELAAWSMMLSANGDLTDLFSNPTVLHSSKEKVLEELIKKTQPSPTTSNFVRVLLQNGRLSDLREINDRFAAVLDERSNLVSAEIMSARELPATERAAFVSNLEKLTGKQVHVNYTVREEIIGGTVTRIGSTVYDGSVKTKLENLREQLVNG